MSETVTCPGCGTANPAGAQQCRNCNFPLGDAPRPAAAPPEAAPEEHATTSSDDSTKAGEPSEMPVALQRPQRPRRVRPDAMQPVQMQIWLFVGIAIVLGLVYFAAQGFWTTHVTPVEGASHTEQQRADLARRAIEKDTTNVAARIELANVLYDTGNWSEAIVQYRSAERLDPHRSTTVVDMGVCYYNLSAFATAESLFTHALAIDPQQIFALFNLGIVAESRADWNAAVDYFHRVMELNPPEGMRPIVEQHLQAAMEKTGRKAPPLGGASPPHEPH